MDPRLPHAARAARHRLLGDVRRLAIVEALEEGPRQIPELARILGVHPTTVRAHLERLLEAGVLDEERGTPAGRGRPSKRYRLRQPLLGGDPELRLFVSTLVSLLRQAYGEQAPESAQEEGTRRGRAMVGTLRHPSFEQAVQEVVGVLERLSFAPTAPVQQDRKVAVEVRHCPFNVDPQDPDGAIVCAFHEGLVKGVADAASAEPVAVRLLPFVAPGLCRVELSQSPPEPADRPARKAKSSRSSGGKATKRRS